MTWRTEVGTRILTGAEAALYTSMMGMAFDCIINEIDFEGLQVKSGIPILDRLEPIVRLALLTDVSWALLRETPSPPPLRAINEAIIGALFRELYDCVQLEIDCGNKDDEEGGMFWRTRILAVFHQLGDTEDLPDVNCSDLSAWDILIETLTDRILWDRDFEEEFFLDKPPEHAEFLKNMMAIDPEYYTAIPPDPKASEIEKFRKMINELYRDGDVGSCLTD